MSNHFDSHDGHTQSDHHKSAAPGHTSDLPAIPKSVEPTPQKPSIGRIVHFVLPDGPSKSEHRPAIVVNDWQGKHPGVNLQVFTDGENDGAKYASGIHWATSVPYSDPSENKLFSYHWPERV